MNSGGLIATIKRSLKLSADYCADEARRASDAAVRFGFKRVNEEAEEAESRCRDAIAHLNSLPDDAVLIGLTREDWRRVVKLLGWCSDRLDYSKYRGDCGRVADEIVRQVEEV